MIKFAPIVIVAYRHTLVDLIAHPDEAALPISAEILNNVSRFQFRGLYAKDAEGNTFSRETAEPHTFEFFFRCGIYRLSAYNGDSTREVVGGCRTDLTENCTVEQMIEILASRGVIVADLPEEPMEKSRRVALNMMPDFWHREQARGHVKSHLFRAAPANTGDIVEPHSFNEQGFPVAPFVAPESVGAFVPERRSAVDATKSEAKTKHEKNIDSIMNSLFGDGEGSIEPEEAETGPDAKVEQPSLLDSVLSRIAEIDKNESQHIYAADQLAELNPKARWLCDVMGNMTMSEKGQAEHDSEASLPGQFYGLNAKDKEKIRRSLSTDRRQRMR